MEKRLIFVYNANSGKINLYMDILHKIVSPATYPCSLCAITHDTFKVKQEWVDFKKEIPLPMEFLHKDEWEQQYSYRAALPAIFLKEDNALETLIPAEMLNKMSLEGLKIEIKKAIKPKTCRDTVDFCD